MKSTFLLRPRRIQNRVPDHARVTLPVGVDSVDVRILDYRMWPGVTRGEWSKEPTHGWVKVAFAKQNGYQVPRQVAVPRIVLSCWMLHSSHSWALFSIPAFLCSIAPTSTCEPVLSSIPFIEAASSVQWCKCEKVESRLTAAILENFTFA